MEISTLVGSVKTVYNIAKALKETEALIENSEARLQMAELMSALANVKIDTKSDTIG